MFKLVTIVLISFGAGIVSGVIICGVVGAKYLKNELEQNPDDESEIDVESEKED